MEKNPCQKIDGKNSLSVKSKPNFGEKTPYPGRTDGLRQSRWVADGRMGLTENRKGLPSFLPYTVEENAPGTVIPIYGMEGSKLCVSKGHSIKR